MKRNITKFIITIGLTAGLCFLASCQWNPKQDVVDKNSASWMSRLPDSAKLTELTIPGTHDTCAIYDFLIGGASAAQDIPLYQQLEYGVRFLDIRVSKQKNTLGIYHGIKYMYTTFNDVVLECKRFLEKHPKEFIIMMVKEEVFRSQGAGSSFTDDIYNIIKGEPNLWADPTSWGGTDTHPFPENIAPLRRKILLLRNYKESAKGTTPGISIYNKDGKYGNYWEWAGDSAYVPQGDIKTIDDKWNQVSGYIDTRATKTDNGKLYMHSVAAYNALVLGLPNIDNVAKVVNPRLITKLKNDKAKLSGKPIGILMCDKVNPELITSIYELNTFNATP